MQFDRQQRIIFQSCLKDDILPDELNSHMLSSDWIENSCGDQRERVKNAEITLADTYTCRKRKEEKGLRVFIDLVGCGKKIKK